MGKRKGWEDARAKVFWVVIDLIGRTWINPNAAKGLKKSEAFCYSLTCVFVYIFVVVLRAAVCTHTLIALMGAKVGVNYIVVTISALLHAPTDLFRMVLHALVRKVGRTRGPRFFGLLSTRAVVRGSTQMQQKA